MLPSGAPPSVMGLTYRPVCPRGFISQRIITTWLLRGRAHLRQQRVRVRTPRQWVLPRLVPFRRIPQRRNRGRRTGVRGETSLRDRTRRSRVNCPHLEENLSQPREDRPAGESPP